jgi:hypothetical protein
MTREQLYRQVDSLPEGRQKSIAIQALENIYRGKSVGLSPEKQALYWQEPKRWVEERAKSFIWSKQEAIACSIRDHQRTAVKSCHSAGKSYIAALEVLRFLESHPAGTATVITSAPTWRQVRAILWKEIRRIHARAGLIGRTNQTEILFEINGADELVAFGLKPADKETTSFQGQHALHILLVFDEANGMSQTLWDAAETLLTNQGARFLVIGNPDDPTSGFYKACLPGSGYNVITISAYDTPNFTGEPVPEDLERLLLHPDWVYDKIKRWGTNHPFYFSKILGEFPKHASHGMIPVTHVLAAQIRELIPKSTDPVEMGVDVGAGHDETVVSLRHGPLVRIIFKSQNPNTMESLEDILQLMSLHQPRICRIDSIGVGKGIVDRAQQISQDQELLNKNPDYANLAARIYGVNVGLPSNDPEHYINLRAEGYATLRDRFVDGQIDIGDDEELAAQLVAIRSKRSGGREQVESKRDMLARGIASPDEADSVMLAFLDSYPDDVSWTW